MRHINRAAPVEARHTMSSANHHAGQPLWAITSYFNPMRYKRKLANYRLFREHLPLPLITVELSFGANDFDLREGEADILIQLRGGDVLWQKERLLNVALRALPSECTKVVWLDCDVVFGGGGWAEEVSGLLDEFPLVQAFSRIHHLPRDLGPGELSPADAEFSRSSTASLVASGRVAVLQADLDPTKLRVLDHRHELLERVRPSHAAGQLHHLGEPTVLIVLGLHGVGEVHVVVESFILDRHEFTS